MTTKVTVEAQCPEDVRVSVNVQSEYTEQSAFLENGDKWEEYVYDDRVITVQEIRVEAAGTEEIPQNEATG